jgi:replicative DNA helicase
MEKLLPQNIEAEQGVLGSLLIDPDALDIITDRLKANDFYRESHRILYESILALASRESKADVVTIRDELERTGQLAQVEESVNFFALVNMVPTSGNIDYYAGIVARTSLHRRLIHAAGCIAALGYQEEPEALEQSEKMLFELGQHASSSSDPETAARILDPVLDRLLTLQRQRDIIGVPTGFTDIDKCLGGLQKSDLIILAGRPAMGKSAFAMSIAYNAVYQHMQKVVVFSLEMSKEQLIQRLLSFEAKIPLYQLRNGLITEDEQWERLIEAGNRLYTDHLIIDDTAGIAVPSLRSKARRLMASVGLDLIIVDYLQLMHAVGDNKSRNREQEVAEISKGLKEIAKELNVPVLALAQLSRAVETRREKVPQLSDLRESGSLEQDSDVVMFIYRDDVYAGTDEAGNSLSTHPGVADIIIAKHRNGPIGNVSLRFNAAETRFEDL